MTKSVQSLNNKPLYGTILLTFERPWIPTYFTFSTQLIYHCFHGSPKSPFSAVKLLFSYSHLISPSHSHCSLQCTLLVFLELYVCEYLSCLLRQLKQHYADNILVHTNWFQNKIETLKNVFHLRIEHRSPYMPWIPSLLPSSRKKTTKDLGES